MRSLSHAFGPFLVRHILKIISAIGTGLIYYDTRENLNVALRQFDSKLLASRTNSTIKPDVKMIEEQKAFSEDVITFLLIMSSISVVLFSKRLD